MAKPPKAGYGELCSKPVYQEGEGGKVKTSPLLWHDNQSWSLRSQSNAVRHQVELSEYKQQVADLYSRRSSTYDNGDWHPRIAHHLVEYAHIRPGQQVLRYCNWDRYGGT